MSQFYSTCVSILSQRRYDLCCIKPNNKKRQSLAGELYLVEHTFRADATSFLLLWPGVELSRDEDRATFLQRSTGGTLDQNSSNIPVLDAGIDNQHPYITVAHSTQAQEILQEHLRSLEPTLQAVSESYPNDPHARTEAFLRLFIASTARGKNPESVKSDLAEASTIPLPRNGHLSARGNC